MSFFIPTRSYWHVFSVYFFIQYFSFFFHLFLQLIKRPAHGLLVFFLASVAFLYFAPFCLLSLMGCIKGPSLFCQWCA